MPLVELLCNILISSKYLAPDNADSTIGYCSARTRADARDHLSRRECEDFEDLFTYISAVKLLCNIMISSNTPLLPTLSALSATAMLDGRADVGDDCSP